jgi:hypothetical protein
MNALSLMAKNIGFFPTVLESAADTQDVRRRIEAVSTLQKASAS